MERQTGKDKVDCLGRKNQRDGQSNAESMAELNKAERNEKLGNIT